MVSRSALTTTTLFRRHLSIAGYNLNQASAKTRRSSAVHPCRRQSIRTFVIIALTALSLMGCAHSPTENTTTTQNYPPLSGPGRIFVYDHALTDDISDDTKTTRYVLYDNGTFVLQYLIHPGEFRGGYTVANGVVTFSWDVTDTWGATGTLNGNSLTVQYNERMKGADFDDAAYVLVP